MSRIETIEERIGILEADERMLLDCLRESGEHPEDYASWRHELHLTRERLRELRRIVKGVRA